MLYPIPLQTLRAIVSVSDSYNTPYRVHDMPVVERALT